MPFDQHDKLQSDQMAWKISRLNLTGDYDKDRDRVSMYMYNVKWKRLSPGLQHAVLSRVHQQYDKMLGYSKFEDFYDEEDFYPPFKAKKIIIKAERTVLPRK